MPTFINAQLPGSYQSALDEIRSAYPWMKDVKNNALIRKAVDDMAQKAKEERIRAQLHEAIEQGRKFPPRTKEEQERVQKEQDAYIKKHGIEALGRKLFKEFGLE